MEPHIRGKLKVETEIICWVGGEAGAAKGGGKDKYIGGWGRRRWEGLQQWLERKR